MKHPFANLIGLKVELMEAGRSVCSLAVTEQLKNPQQVIHGAVLYALADTGMGAALYPLLEDGYLCATIDIKMNYYAPVYEGELRCETSILNKGKSIANLASEVSCDGKLVATANGNYSLFKPSRHQ